MSSEKATAFVPPLWRYEVSAMLARSEIKGLSSARKAAEFLEDLAALDIRVDDESVRRVLNDVHQLLCIAG